MKNQTNRTKIVIGQDETGIWLQPKKLTGGAVLIFFLLFLALFSNGQTQENHCKAITKAGEPCKGYKEKGSDFCHFHNPANQCEANKKDGTKCHAIKVKGSKFCSHHQTN